jgi:phage repressor protein C with HTH and peptisase S24 domain
MNKTSGKLPKEGSDASVFVVLEGREAGSRLRQWRESRELSREAVAKLIGVSPRALQEYERGATMPKIGPLRRLAELGCDPTWFVTGRTGGEPGVLEIAATAFSGQQAVAENFSAPTSLVEIRHYAVGLSAGDGRKAPDYDDYEPFILQADWVRRVLKRAPDNLVAAHAEGHSMAPTIADRDLLVIDTADQKLTSGRIYALVVGDNLLVKRIDRTLRGQIFLRPDNPAYQTEELTEDLADTVRVLGQVIWHGGSLE